MAATYGQMKCKLYLSAFSGEAVFQVDTNIGQSYEGVAPKHYVEPSTQLTKDGINGQVRVHVLNNSGNEARVSVPDGQILTVSADKVHEIGFETPNPLPVEDLSLRKTKDGTAFSNAEPLP